MRPVACCQCTGIRSAACHAEHPALVPICRSLIIIPCPSHPLAFTRRLSACAMAGILVGDIDKWNDPVLKKLNPEVRWPMRLAGGSAHHWGCSS